MRLLRDTYYLQIIYFFLEVKVLREQNANLDSELKKAQRMYLFFIILYFL